MSSNRSQRSVRSGNSQQRSERSTRRTRTLTSKGKEYLLEQLHTNYRLTKRSWRTCMNRLIASLVTENQSDILKRHCTNLEAKLFEMTKALERLEAELTLEEKDELYEEFDNLTQENTEALKLANDKLRELTKSQERSPSRSSYKSSRTESSRKSSRNSYYESSSSKISKHSQQPSHHSSRRSHNSQNSSSIYKLSSKYSSSASSSSKCSVSSPQSKRRTDLKEKAESLEEKLDLTKNKNSIEEKYEDELLKIHKQRFELDKDERKLQDELRRYHEIVKAEEDLYRDVAEREEHRDYLPREDGKKRLMQRFLEQSRQQAEFNPMSRDEPEDSKNKENVHYPEQCSTRSTLVERELINVVKTLAQNQRRLDLPSPEPSVFCGDYLQYPSWIQAFDTLIENKTTEPKERIHYLRKYIAGEAKEAIDGLLLLNSEDAYRKAKDVLTKRYGDAFAVANAYRLKLESWPKVQNGDAKGLRRFADFLVHCEIAMSQTKGLHVLDDDLENRKLVTKLPKWLVNRWTREAYQYKENNGCFPPFKEFVKFVNKESDIANDPVFSIDALEIQPVNKGKANPVKTSKVASSFQSSTSKDISSPIQLTSSTPPTAQVIPAEPASQPSKNEQPTCLLCSSHHAIDQCEQFLQRAVQERKDFASTNRLCFACLNPGHRSKDCKNRKTCSICGKSHPTALHGDVRASVIRDTDNPQPQPSPSDVIKANANNTNVKFSSAAYSMIVPVWLYHKDDPTKEKLVYALLDDQSDTTFVKERVLKDLGVSGERTQLCLSTLLAENMMIETYKVTGLAVQDFNRQVTITLPRTFSRESVPAQRSQIPRPEAARQWSHLEHIADNLMPYSKDVDVGLLIGLDCTRALVPREVIPGDNNSPYALRTDLGWGIVGMFSKEYDVQDKDDGIEVSHRVLLCQISNPEASCCFTRQSTVKEVIDPRQINKMFELDFSEVDHGSQKSLSLDEKRFLQKLQASIVQTEDGHYQMPLPFSEESPILPNNRALATHRLRKLQLRLSHDPVYHSFYTKAMNDVISKGFAEKVPDHQATTEAGKVWYIPHHGVFHPKKPDKLRVVYDCSAKYKGESLNDHLLAGPDLTNNLVGVLCRFRQEPFAFMGDIEGMFHQFKVEESHRDFLRFLWWVDGNLQVPPVEYRMTVHLFGAKSSPGCANYGLKKIASDHENEFGTDVADFIRRDFYVDDGLKSLPTEEDAISVIQKSKEMCARGGLRLHKFTSNSRRIIDSIPPEDRANDLKEIDLQRTKLPVERVLGVQWSIENDAFQFKIDITSKPYTRRGILSTVSSIYDPLGFIAPVILSGKRILQDLTKDNYDWDEPVPEEVKDRWDKWVNTLPALENIHIDRCYKPNDFEPSSFELHHFSDASSHGYGQCSYLRMYNQNQVHCSFVMGKARVAPQRPITIPRLELTAALLSTKISSSLHEELDLTEIEETFWTDSQVVLGYLNNHAKRFHVFVANRVQQIRDHCSPENWRYVKSSENPADIASRGISADELHDSSWLKGPSFLWTREIPKPDKEKIIQPLNSEDPEVKQAHTLSTAATDVKMATILQRLEYFSDWSRAKRAVAICLKFTRKLRNKTHDLTPLAVTDLEEAEELIIKLLQDNAFSDEKKILQDTSKTSTDHSNKKQSITKKSSLRRLDPFLDERGVMRVGGRIRYSDSTFEIKHPILIPRKGHVTELIVRAVHEQAEHQGRGMTLNELRNRGYWITGGSSAIEQYIHNCVTCKKLRGKTEYQKMGNLPRDRLEPAPPFTYCAVDFFGPWYIKDGRKVLKRYGVLFTCMSCRAIHLETANALDTSAFINALRRFISRRGPIRQLRSDRGTNFVGAKKELQEAVKGLDEGKIHQFLLEKKCDWFQFEMNVPSASHMGGVWERQIRTVRAVLSALLEDHGQQLDDESLRTLMCEAESVVNSRPLTVDSLCSPTAPEPLTPNHLLTGKTKVVLPPPSEFQHADIYSRRRWRRVQYLVNQFWFRWKREFMLSLQQRQKWSRPRRNMQVNDIVLLKDEEQPRNQWPLARVQACEIDKDGYVRKVRLLLGNLSLDAKGKRIKSSSILERPIHKVVLLVPNERLLQD